MERVREALKAEIKKSHFVVLTSMCQDRSAGRHSTTIPLAVRPDDLSKPYIYDGPVRSEHLTNMGTCDQEVLQFAMPGRIQVQLAATNRIMKAN